MTSKTFLAIAGIWAFVLLAGLLVAIGSSESLRSLQLSLPDLMNRDTCENESVIRTLKDLAKSKLGSGTDYLLPHVTPAFPPPPAGSPLSYLSATELMHYQSQVQKILTLGQVVVSSGQGTLILTPLAIRDRGNLASGRACAAFIKVVAAAMGSTPALVFEIAASYKFERTSDAQIVVTASFSPK